MSTLAKLYDVSAATVQDWKRRGVPVNDPAAMADWVMNEPRIREGYDRAQAVADSLPNMARRAASSGDMAFATDALEALAGWLSLPHCHALTVTRLTGASCSGR
jgi:phage terminase Nu1 subunit (DNA packaging protein)